MLLKLLLDLVQRCVFSFITLIDKRQMHYYVIGNIEHLKRVCLGFTNTYKGDQYKNLGTRRKFFPSAIWNWEGHICYPSLCIFFLEYNTSKFRQISAWLVPVLDMRNKQLLTLACTGRISFYISCIVKESDNRRRLRGPSFSCIGVTAIALQPPRKKIHYS